MTTKRDYYEVLGVAKNASDAEVKKAFRRLDYNHHQKSEIHLHLHLNPVM